MRLSSIIFIEPPMSTLWMRRLSYSALLFLLTAGASILLGFLSFTGVLAVWPILSLAFTSFGLCFVFESDVIWKNIDGAMNKLFNPHYFEYAFGKEFLLRNAPSPTQLPRNKCPQFFIDYNNKLKINDRHQTGPSTPESKQKIRRCEHRLQKMEEWFSHQLFHINPSDTVYANEIHEWIKRNTRVPEKRALLALLKKRNAYIQKFSILAGFFMGLGSTYLLMEAFMAIPVLAALSGPILPAIIVPTAIIAGLAYGLQTYHAFTDMLAHQTIERWYQKVMDDIDNKHFLFPGIAIFLCITAIALTICTAGTWWTIAKQGKPLFEWMKKLPTVIMGVITPIITGIASLGFTLQNTSESLQLAEDIINAPEVIKAMNFKPLEPWYIRYNPFGLLITYAIDPLMILLYSGHVLTDAIISAQMPWLPHAASIAIGGVNNAWVDLHFFFHPPEKDHGHTSENLRKQRLQEQHEHEHNIPEQLLRFLFTPIIYLAAGWDALFGQFSWKGALKRHAPLSRENEVCRHRDNSVENMQYYFTPETPTISHAWKVEEGLLQIEQTIEPELRSVWFDKNLAKTKLNIIGELKAELKNSYTQSIHKSQIPDPSVMIHNTSARNPILHRHRHPWFSIWSSSRCIKTHTVARLDEMTALFLT